MQMFVALLILGLGAPVSTRPGLRVEGTEFVLAGADGREQRSAGLVGAELELGAGVVVRIDGVERDPADAGVWLHRFSVRDGSDWNALCQPDADGKQLGFPLAGDFDDTGRFVDKPGVFSLACTSGAQAKCVRFGYAYWRKSPDGASLRPQYEACLRMVRADYCGDGVPATRDGTTIDVYDDHGVQRTAGDPGFRFEAGWSSEGAVCVNHMRVESEAMLDELAARCPRLATRLGASCTEASARERGAVLFNRSK